MHRITKSQTAAFAARLRAGKSNRGACPGVDGFTNAEWAELDKLVYNASLPPSHHERDELEEVFER